MFSNGTNIKITEFNDGVSKTKNLLKPKYKFINN